MSPFTSTYPLNTLGLWDSQGNEAKEPRGGKEEGHGFKETRHASKPVEAYRVALGDGPESGSIQTSPEGGKPILDRYRIGMEYCDPTPM